MPYVRHVNIYTNNKDDIEKGAHMPKGRMRLKREGAYALRGGAYALGGGAYALRGVAHVYKKKFRKL